MARLLFTLPVLLGSPASAKDFSPDQHGELRCVATLAVIANDQQRGAPGGDMFPDVTQSGAHFAAIVQKRISSATGVSDAKIKGEVRKQIEALQKEAIESENPEELVRGIVPPCLDMMARLDPPPRTPSDLRCAALSAIAHQDMRARDGVTNPVTAMMVLASVFESEARKGLFAQGKTQVESDAIMGLEREIVANTPISDAEAVYRNGAELRACMASVRPQLEKKPH